jgi:hypothetical protein
MAREKFSITGTDAALAAWRKALPVAAMRELAAMGYDEAARLRWIKAVAPQVDAWDAVDMAADAYIAEVTE